MSEDLTYENAMHELSEILSDLERSEVDVDVLATKVGRGKELLQFCESRLEKVGQEIADLVDTSSKSETD